MAVGLGAGIKAVNASGPIRQLKIIFFILHKKMLRLRSASNLKYDLSPLFTRSTCSKKEPR